MSKILNIKLIKITDTMGEIIINNHSNISISNWEFELICKNFKINSIVQLNYSYNQKSYFITPKEWKINIESNSRITSKFEYSKFPNISDFEYEYDIIDIKYTTLNNPGIEITIQNNTDTDIIIKPGETYTFSY